jgi:hypothetical protein
VTLLLIIKNKKKLYVVAKVGMGTFNDSVSYPDFICVLTEIRDYLKIIAEK